MIALSAAAFAADPEPFALRNEQPLFLASEFVGSALVGFVLPDLLLKDPPDPLTCADAWCDPTGFDEALNRALVWGDPKAAATTSHVFTLLLTPAAAFGSAIAGGVGSGHGSYALQDSIVVLDAFLLSTGPNSIAKLGARRQRPAFYYGREDRTEAARYPGEEFLSFYSGDTNWAFALAASGTTLAYLRGYPHARWVAIGSGALALTGGVLRVSADMHWATDVVTGAVAGTAIGVGVPLLLHGRAADGPGAATVGLVPTPGMIVFQGRW